MSNIKDTKVYSLNDFLNWYDRNELTISPKYQRNPVWNHKAKSYLIDTIIKGLPMPQIFMRQVIDTTTRTTMREIIDGQQRLRAIIEFVENKFQILKSHNEEYANYLFQDLPDKVQESFLEYDIPVELIKIKDDSKIYDMFARLNTNSISLNPQELRNAKFWGEFKVFIYRLSSECRFFFLDTKTFKDTDFARMRDIEFVSSLIILLLSGVKSESRQIVDNYYKEYDEVFSEIDIIEHKFKRIFNIIEKIFSNDLFSTSWFHRTNYFYTLYSSIVHQVYGIQNIDSIRNPLFDDNSIDNNISLLVGSLMEFESNYVRFLDEQFYDPEKIKLLIKFEQHHRTRTTSQSERVERISILNNEVFGE